MKTRRHFAIMEIITELRVGTQEELCENLKQRGFDVTQATVSRDIKELQLVKIADSQGYRYDLPENSSVKSSYERMKRMFSDNVVFFDCSMNIIVVKTLPGAAQSVASVIDSYESIHILGTVAGDDTILVVVKPVEVVETVARMFEDMLKP